MIARVLETTGATVWARVTIYNVVVRSVILYGSKSWGVNGEMLKVLTGFHHGAARRITGMTEKRGVAGECYYPSVEEATEAARLHPIGMYIKLQQTTIADRLSCLPVYTLCSKAERMPGMSRLVQWWNRDAVNEPDE